MWTAVFWKATAERAIRAAAATLIALVGGDLVAITDLDWPNMLEVAATAGGISVLMSILATGVGDPDSPSFIRPKEQPDA